MDIVMNDVARLEARIPTHLKDNLVLAAKLKGLSQTNFLILALNEAINKTITEQSHINLCIQDMELLQKSMENKSEKALPRLKQAWEDYKQMVENE